jgi:peptidoglycan hydrolase-like protein with peptidoglycan-binding domain
MSPGQARIALLSFLLVMCGVAFNALYLQGSAQPRSRVVAERTPPRAPTDAGIRVVEPVTARESLATGEQALRIARFGADPDKIERSAASSNEVASGDTIRAIQRELRLRGYGPISGDGTITITTRAAIMAFEHDNGMGLSGEVSDRLLKRILLGVADPASGDSTGAGKVRSVHAEQVIRDVQQRLAAQGYRPGSIDGRPGDDTVRAIRDFEMDKGLVPRGRVSAELVARLVEPGASRTPGR